MIYIKEKLKEFKSLLSVVTNLGLETNLTFMPDGIFIRIVHSSNIAMIVTTIKKSLFEKYEIDKEKTYTVDNTALMKCINKIGKNELQIEILPTGIKFKNDKNDKLLLNYYIGQKDERNIPYVNSGSSWELNPGVFINELGEAVEFGNIGIFTGDKELVLGIKSQLINGNINLDGLKISDDEYKAYFDMGEFIYVSAVRHVFDKVIFSYNEDLCSIDGKSQDIDFKWILAARVDDE